MRPPESREQLAGPSGIAKGQHAAAHIVPADLEEPAPRTELAQAFLLGAKRDAVLAAILGDEARRALDVGAVGIETGDIGAERQGREQGGPAATQRIDDVERRPVA